MQHGLARSSGSRQRGAFVILAFAISLILPAGSGAAGGLSTPSFVRSWEATPEGIQVAVDPGGDILVLTRKSTNARQVFRFTAEGAPVADGGFEVPGQYGGLATDSAGHVYVAGSGELRMYTSTGGLLATFELERPVQGRVAVDANDHVYLTESGGNSAPVINEYAFEGGEPTLVHTAPFIGDADPIYVPQGYFDVVTDSTGYVYANGNSTSNRYIARFPPGFVGPHELLDDCSGAGYYNCFPGSGLAIAMSRFTSGDEEALYVAGGRTDTSVSTRGTQVHSLTRPTGGRQHFGPQPDPSGAGVSAFDVAASPCRASVYTLNAVFGGPNGTFSGNRIEQYDTHVAPTACAGPRVAAIGDLNKRVYRLRAVKSAPGPCTRCAAILPSGEFARPGAGRRLPRGAATAKPTRGAKLKFDTSVGGDLTFAFRGPRGKKAKRRGGFVYAAHVGPNTVRFTGVIRKGRPLAAGSYRATVRTVDGATVERFKVQLAR